MEMRINVDNSGDIFAAKVTIADLARFSFNGQSSDHLTVYEAAAILQRDWRDEVVDDSMEMENGVGTRVRFKDGTAISVGAWADCCDGNSGPCRQCWYGVTRFDREA